MAGCMAATNTNKPSVSAHLHQNEYITKTGRRGEEEGGPCLRSAAEAGATEDSRPA